MFQYPEYQLFEETCYKDIAFGPKNMGLDEAEIDRRVHEAADFVGLDPALLERSPFELSGGQKQRTLIARALCATDRLLILDEPITGLDPSTTQDFYRVIRHLNREEQVAVLMVSHDIQNIVAQANKILHLKQSVLFYGSVEDYKQTECGREFLGGGK